MAGVAGLAVRLGEEKGRARRAQVHILVISEQRWLSLNWAYEGQLSKTLSSTGSVLRGYSSGVKEQSVEPRPLYWYRYFSHRCSKEEGLLA